MKQRSKLKGIILACHLTASLADKVMGVYAYDVVHKSLLLNGLCPDDMAVVTMCGMVGIGYHVGLIALDDSTQVALALADMGGNLEATIKNFKAVNALTDVVCYNELHNVFCVCLVKLCLTAVKAEVCLATAASQRAFALVYVLAHCRKTRNCLFKLD